MTDRSNENVPRGDHVPGGPNDASAAEMNQKEARAEPESDAAPKYVSGAHGEGADGREEQEEQ